MFPTVLDNQGQGTVASITGHITATLAGFRITGGFTANTGAGVQVVDAAGTIANNVITGNIATSAGGGVAFFNSIGGTLSGKQILSNTSQNVGGFLIYGGDVLRTSNVISGTWRSISAPAPLSPVG